MGLLKCHVCHKNDFTSLKEYSVHLRSHTPPIPIPCGVDGCETTFTLVSSVKRHIAGSHSSVVDSLSVSDSGPSTSAESASTYSEDQQKATSAEEWFAEASTSQVDDGPETPLDVDLHSLLVDFVCDIGKNPGVTDATINDVVEGANELITNVSELIKHNISVALAGQLSPGVLTTVEKTLEDNFGEVGNSLNKFRTSRLRQSILHDEGLYELPREVILGGPEFDPVRRNNSTVVHNRKRYDKAYYLDIKHTLKRVLSNEKVQEKLLWVNNQHPTQKSHYFDGDHMKDLYSRIKKPFIVIELYYDDVEPGNPLGSKAAVNKIGVFYITIKNLPNYFNSCGANIHLVAVGYSGDFKHYGYASILEHFYLQLAELENGIEIELKRGQLTGIHNLPVVLGTVVGDNLAVHQALGFKESFTAIRFCRSCLITSNNLHNDPVSIRYAARNQLDHDAVANSLNEENSKEFGIKFPCPLNKLRYFHCTRNYGVDMMHDFHEGVLPIELSYILRHLIYVENFFTLDQLNTEISRFPYGRSMKSKKPSQLVGKILREWRPLKQYAAQSATLLILLPLMIGDLVPSDNQYYLQLLDLHDIFCMLLAPVVKDDYAHCFHVSWSHHVVNFCHLFPNFRPTPKFHFGFHYGNTMIKSGPVYYQMCMKHETKNNFFVKASKNMKCFKNVPLTLAHRNQRSVARTIRTCAVDRDITVVGPGHTIARVTLPTKLSELLSNSQLFVANWIDWRGTEYHANDFVVLDLCNEEGHPCFGKIARIVKQDDMWYFLVEDYHTVWFTSHLRAYEIRSKRNYILVNVVQLKYHKTFDPYEKHGSLFIPRQCDLM